MLYFVIPLCRLLNTKIYHGYNLYMYYHLLLYEFNVGILGNPIG